MNINNKNKRKIDDGKIFDVEKKVKFEENNDLDNEENNDLDNEIKRVNENRILINKLTGLNEIYKIQNYMAEEVFAILSNDSRDNYINICLSYLECENELANKLTNFMNENKDLIRAEQCEIQAISWSPTFKKYKSILNSRIISMKKFKNLYKITDNDNEKHLRDLEDVKF